MALNSVGLGFAFGAKDDGLLSMQEKTAKGFARIGGVLGDLNSLASKFTSTGMNLANDLETARTRWDKSARAIIADAGYTDEAFDRLRRQATSMAEGLNLSADVAAEAAVAYERLGKEFSEAGLSSASDVAKFFEITGIRGKQMAKVLKTMAGADLRRFGNMLAFAGGELKSVSGATQFMIDNLDLFRERTGLTGKSAANFAQEMLLGSSFFMHFTEDAGIATKAMTGFSKGLFSSEKNLARLRSGLVQGLPPQLKELGITSQSLDKAFAIGQKDPAAALREILSLGQQIFKVGGEEGLGFFMTRMQEAFGTDFGTMLATAIRGGGGLDALDKLTEAAGKANTTLKDLTDLRTTGRTLQEWLVLYEKQFVTKFRRLGGTHGSIVKEMKGAMDSYSKTLSDIAGDPNAPLHEFVKVMSRAHSIGAQEFLPKFMRPMAVVFGMTFKTLSPVISGMQQLGLEITDLFSPMKLLIGVFGAWAAALAAGMKPEDIANKTIGVFDYAIDTLLSFFQAGPGFLKTSKGIFAGFRNVFNSVVNKLTGEVLPSFWYGLVDGFTAEIHGTPLNRYSALGQAIGKAIQAAISFAKPYIDKIFSWISDMFVYHFRNAMVSSGMAKFMVDAMNSMNFVGADAKVEDYFPAGTKAPDFPSLDFSGFSAPETAMGPPGNIPYAADTNMQELLFRMDKQHSLMERLLDIQVGESNRHGPSDR